MLRGSPNSLENVPPVDVLHLIPVVDSTFGAKFSNTSGLIAKPCTGSIGSGSWQTSRSERVISGLDTTCIVFGTSIASQLPFPLTVKIIVNSPASISSCVGW